MVRHDPLLGQDQKFLTRHDEVIRCDRGPACGTLYLHSDRTSAFGPTITVRGL